MRSYKAMDADLALKVDEVGAAISAATAAWYAAAGSILAAFATLAAVIVSLRLARGADFERELLRMEERIADESQRLEHSKLRYHAMINPLRVVIFSLREITHREVIDQARIELDSEEINALASILRETRISDDLRFAETYVRLQVFVDRAQNFFRECLSVAGPIASHGALVDAAERLSKEAESELSRAKIRDGEELDRLELRANALQRQAEKLKRTAKKWV